jgi:uncharacterized protein YfaS (alpha-2-macroglobulin family)
LSLQVFFFLDKSTVQPGEMVGFTITIYNLFDSDVTAEWTLTLNGSELRRETVQIKAKSWVDISSGFKAPTQAGSYQVCADAKVIG